MQQTDQIGRATFHHITPQSGVNPTNREIRWLKHIERHGPQSSTYLYELTRDTHRCKDTALRQMQKLRAGGFLCLPRQQRATEHADFNAFIYDLTKRGREFLLDRGISEPTVTPHGHWVHQYMTACVSSSIDIAARGNGVRYIPAHEILAIKGASFEIPMGPRKLVPDQLFALDYGGSYRAFALEVDRGTEPKTSRSLRKSYEASIEMYAELISSQGYKSHYGLKANLLVLWVFSSKGNQARFLEMVAEKAGKAAGSFLTQSVEGFHGWFRPPHVLKELYDRPWIRSKDKGVQLAI